MSGRQGDPRIVPLTRCPLDVVARVVQVISQDPHRADRLAGLGIIAGSELVVLQRRPAFVVEVTIKGQEPLQGRGPSKREAERQAAAALLTKMGEL